MGMTLISDSLHVGNWRAYRDTAHVMVIGPADESMPDSIAVFLGDPSATPASGSTRAPLPADEGASAAEGDRA